jgi:hypothetical protein
MSHFEGYYNMDAATEGECVGGTVNAASMLMTSTPTAIPTADAALEGTTASSAPVVQRCNSCSSTSSYSSKASNHNHNNNDNNSGNNEATSNTWKPLKMKRSRSNVSTSNGSNNQKHRSNSKNFWEDSAGTFVLNTSQPQAMHILQTPESLYCGMPTVTDYGDDDCDDDEEVPSPNTVDQKSGIFGAVANLANSIVGGGIVGMPYAFKLCGFVSGLYLLIVTAILASTYNDTSLESYILCSFLIFHHGWSPIALLLFFHFIHTNKYIYIYIIFLQINH